MVTMTTVSFYMITAYTPTLRQHRVEAHEHRQSRSVTLCVGISNLIWLPIMGALSDRVGRRPLLIVCTVLMLATAYPAMLWLVDTPSFSKLLAVELWFSFVYGSYNGAMVVFLTEIMPVDFRTTGFSLAYSLAAGVFGGFTPGTQHVSDPHHGQPGGSRPVAVVRGGMRSHCRDAGAPAIERSGGRGGLRHGRGHRSPYGTRSIVTISLRDFCDSVGAACRRGTP